MSDLEPIFEATPALRGLLSAEADESGRNTLLSRRFAGGSLKIVAAKSPRNLRRHNVRVLLIDEADAMEPGAEGSPITLADERRRLVREQADREAHRNAVTRGELVAAADVKAEWESILTDVRAAMLAVPSRLPELDRAAVERMDREIRSALEALANG